MYFKITFIQENSHSCDKTFFPRVFLLLMFGSSSLCDNEDVLCTPDEHLRSVFYRSLKSGMPGPLWLSPLCVTPEETYVSSDHMTTFRVRFRPYLKVGLKHERELVPTLNSKQCPTAKLMTSCMIFNPIVSHRHHSEKGMIGGPIIWSYQLSHGSPGTAM